MSDGTDGVIVTYTGVAIKPLEPDPRLINIRDIAHALSNCCRFTGHVKSFYSVAQHSIHVSENVSPELALTGLLHDASEAYLSDVARPIKHQPAFGVVYKAAEDRLMQAVAQRFPIIWPMPAEVREADETLLRTEQRDLMPDLLRFDGDSYLDEEITPWWPDVAEAEFLDRYYELTE